MESPKPPTNGASSVDSRICQNGSQASMTSEIRPSWRPYRGRWRSKKANRRGTDELDATTPESSTAPSARLRRPRRNKQSAERRNQEETNIQASQPTNTGSYTQGNPAQNGLMNFDNFNPAPMFSGVSAGMAMPNENGPVFQQPFLQFPWDQQQFLPQYPPGQPAHNPFGLPTWNDQGTYAGQFPPMPPPAFMNFALTNPLMAIPFLGPMAFQAAGSAEVSSQLPGSPSTKQCIGDSESWASPEGAPNAVSDWQPRDLRREAAREYRGKVRTGKTEYPGQPRSKSPEVTVQLKRPMPTKAYLDQSSQPPKRNSWSQPLLIILDLNGTLVHRKDRSLPPRIRKRAGLEDFIKTLMQKYKVMVWSSARPPTVDGVCRQLFLNKSRTRLVAEWSRDHFNLPKKQYNAKIQVYKTLGTVWADEGIQASYPGLRDLKAPVPDTFEKARWDQTNTILIDDTIFKASSEPHNLLEIPTFDESAGPEDATTLAKVLRVLEELAKHDDVSQALHHWQPPIPNGGSILDLDIEHDDGRPHGPPTLAEVTEARKQRRKARKREKAAENRRARQNKKLEERYAAKVKEPPTTMPTAIISAESATAGADTTPVHPSSSSSPPPSPASSISFPDSTAGGATIPTAQGKANAATHVSDSTNRSPSPAPSTQSENFLLDRLEESLKNV
ncbi:HAD-like protein [Aspergillus sclerotioniger CBS 115572]|uniref:HAD-like protein n=1 Tax=Aspergillus sclerotioniger CBS 115572 TaxID=1450535 RepID=A0A317VIB0_9EURO|nr:HAD-like protein [Aspergillus sclerotioniger CBS 115572]PWY71570.1 HAD-like protein [Aspergillus sclerotioniger CBS 115572]